MGTKQPGKPQNVDPEQQRRQDLADFVKRMNPDLGKGALNRIAKTVDAALEAWVDRKSPDPDCPLLYRPSDMLERYAQRDALRQSMAAELKNARPSFLNPWPEAGTEPEQAPYSTPKIPAPLDHLVGPDKAATFEADLVGVYARGVIREVTQQLAAALVAEYMGKDKPDPVRNANPYAGLHPEAAGESFAARVHKELGMFAAALPGFVVDSVAVGLHPDTVAVIVSRNRPGSNMAYCRVAYRPKLDGGHDGN